MAWTPPDSDEPPLTRGRRAATAPADPAWSPPASDQPGSQGASSDPFIADLQAPGFEGSLARGAAGLTQGFVLDPVEKVGEVTGLNRLTPDWLNRRAEANREAANHHRENAGITGDAAEAAGGTVPIEGAKGGQTVSRVCVDCGEKRLAPDAFQK